MGALARQGGCSPSHGFEGRNAHAANERFRAKVGCADLRRMGLELFDPAATLQQREVERLADFLFAKVIGQGLMDQAKCIEFWGTDVDVCSEVPD